MLLFSCEHFGNRIPDEISNEFNVDPKILVSHRGYDRGAAELFSSFAAKFKAPAYYYEFTRLAIDANRSLKNRSVFSNFSSNLDPRLKNMLVSKYYSPYRAMVEENLKGIINSEERAIHISVHSFTPLLNGKIRNADVTFLYDPSRANEKEISQKWQKKISELMPDLKIRMNYPYKWVSDGFTSHLRSRFSDSMYSGIELEINQKLFNQSTDYLSKFFQMLSDSLFSSAHELSRYYKGSEEFPSATEYSIKKYHGLYYNGLDYYIAHIIPVVERIKALAPAYLENDEEIRTAALSGYFHDIIEDTLTEPYEIAKYFGQTVANTVLKLSVKQKILESSKKLSPDEYYRIIGEDKIAKLVKAADRLINIEKLTEITDPHKCSKLLRKYTESAEYFQIYGIYPEMIKNALAVATKIIAKKE